MGAVNYWVVCVNNFAILWNGLFAAMQGQNRQ